MLVGFQLVNSQYPLSTTTLVWSNVVGVIVVFNAADSSLGNKLITESGNVEPSELPNAYLTSETFLLYSGFGAASVSVVSVTVDVVDIVPEVTPKLHK